MKNLNRKIFNGTENTSYMRPKWVSSWSVSSGSFGQCPWVTSWQQKRDLWASVDTQKATTHFLLKDFAKLSWSFNKKPLGGWVVSTFQDQGTFGIWWAQKPGNWSFPGRGDRWALVANTESMCSARSGSLLLILVYKTHTLEYILICLVPRIV